MMVWMERVENSGHDGIPETEGRSDLAEASVAAGLCTLSERGYFLTGQGHTEVMADRARRRSEATARMLTALEYAGVRIAPLVWQEVPARKWRGSNLPGFWVSNSGCRIDRENGLYNGLKRLADAQKAEEEAHVWQVVSALVLVENLG